MNIRFHKPYPKQEKFLKARNRFIAYGGAKGGGKSDVARIKAIALCLRYAGIQVLFVRLSYKDIKENHLLAAQKILKGVARFSSIDNSFYFPNGARLKFGYCANDRDLLQYQGIAYDVIFLEECTQFPEKVYNAMTESNRSSGMMEEHFTPRMYLTCNPGGVGHMWFKRLFIDRQYKPTENPEDYLFIQASVYDNEWLMKNSPDYERGLKNLPEDRKRAMLYGDWNVFEGQYFPEFREGVHTVEAFTIPDTWRRYRAFDYGFDMFACLWIAVDEKGNELVYKEFCEGADLGEGHAGLLISEAAEKILELSTEKERRALTIAPPDMWNRRQDTGRSAADIFAAAGVPLFQARNERVQGWLDMKEHLRIRADGAPQVRITKNCVQLIKSIPLLLHDKKNPDDVAKEPHEWTHAPDALRYFISAQPLAADVPEEEEPDNNFSEEWNDIVNY